MTKTTWVVLEEANDWGTRFLRLPLPVGAYNSANYRSQAVDVGETVRVRWPDGTITVENVVWDSYTETISDHGHFDRITSKLPSIPVKVSICGYNTVHKIPLSELAVDVESLARVPK